MTGPTTQRWLRDWLPSESGKEVGICIMDEVTEVRSDAFEAVLLVAGTELMVEELAIIAAVAVAFNLDVLQSPTRESLDA